MFARRIAALRMKARKQNLDGMIITHLDHVRYLCGYTGSNGLLAIGGKEVHFLTDFRYKDQARQQVKGAKVQVMDKGDLIACLERFPQLNQPNCRYGVSLTSLSVGARDRLAAVLSKALLVRADDVLMDLGWVKDAGEIALIARAAEIADTALERVFKLVKPGVREMELAAELEYQMKMLGSTRPAFDTIVASGYRSAMPHGEASAKRLRKGEFVTFDFGAMYEGYVSDVTRTVVVGKASPRQKKIYEIVRKAQLAAVRRVRAGVAAQAVDTAARRVIERAGFGKEFGHGTGHGIGFYKDPIHTGPRIGTNSPDKLAVNHVITVEPGIYISGWGGVRIEDDVVVTRTGCRVLNRVTKYLLEL